jgi:hypothetical protein
MVDALATATKNWLELPEEARSECVQRDDPLDSLIAALATRAAQLRLTHLPETADERRLAPLEGWTHVPKAGSLELLPANPAAAR